MAQINLKVKSDFAQASKDLKTFGTISEGTRKQIEKYQEQFKSNSIDSFIDKNRRLGAGIQANKNDISAIIAQQKALENQSIKLIKNGLDPESKEVEKLTGEYNRLQKEYDKTKLASEGMEKASNVAGKTLLGLGVAVAGGAIGMVKLASSVEMVEASFTPLLGSTAKAEELVRELNKTASTTPFQFENIASASKQLLPVMNQDINRTVETFRMLGDTAGGNAQKLESITRGYTKAMLKNKVDMESLNMIAEAGVPIYTELAKSLGVSVEEMTKMSSAGKITSADLTTAFEQMTAEGGLFFNGMEIASQTAEGKLSTVKDIFKLIGATIGKELLPYWKGFLDVVISSGNEVLKFIGDGDNLDKTLKAIGITLAGVSAGLGTFLLLTKGATAIKGMATAFKALNLAMKANPAIFIASAIMTVLIPAIIYAVKNQEELSVRFQTTIKVIEGAFKIAGNTIQSVWEKVKVSLSTSIEVLSKEFKMLGVDIKAGWTIAINALKLAFLSLGSIIVDNVLGAVQKFLEVAGKIPFVGDQFKGLANNVGDVRTAFKTLTDEAKNNTKEVIAGTIAERNAIAETSEKNIQEIVNQGNAKLNQINKDMIAVNTATKENIANVLAEGKVRIEEIKEVEKANDVASKEIEKTSTAVTGTLVDNAEIVTEVEKKSNIIILEDYKKMMKEKEKENQKSLDQYGNYAKQILSEAKQLSSGQKELNLESISDLVTQIGKASGSVEISAVGLGLSFISAISDTFTDSGAQDWEKVLVAVFTVIGGTAVGALTSVILSGIRDSNEKFEELTTDLGNRITEITLNNRRLLAQQEYDIAVQNAKNIEDEKLKAYIATLSEQEKRALISAGVISESATDRIKREIEEAQKAGNQELVNLKNRELAITVIKENSLASQQEAKKKYEKEIADIEYKKAIFDRDLAVAKVRIERDKAVAEVPWYDKLQNKHIQVADSYDNLISQMSNIPLPPAPTAQTGTPMGGFTVPEVMGSQRADNVGLRVSPGEQVTVTPRGESQARPQNIFVQIDKKTIFDIINEGIETRDIRITSDNIQGVA